MYRCNVMTHRGVSTSELINGISIVGQMTLTFWSKNNHTYKKYLITLQCKWKNVYVFQNHIQAYLFVCWYHTPRYNINIKNWSCILMISCWNTSPITFSKCKVGFTNVKSSLQCKGERLLFKSPTKTCSVRALRS